MGRSPIRFPYPFPPPPPLALSGGERGGGSGGGEISSLKWKGLATPMMRPPIPQKMSTQTPVQT